MTTTKRRKARTAKGAVKAMLAEIPTNWCDPLLTGPERILVSGPPYTCGDIERLLNAVRANVADAARRLERKP